MFQHSIRNKLTAVISALIIATLAIIAYFTLSFFIDRYKTAITTQEYTLLSALGNEIDTKMETAHSILIANAEMLPVNDIDHPEKMQAFLDSRAYLQAVFDSNIFVFSPQGKIIAESPYVPGRRGLDVSYRDYIQMTVSTGKPYISEPYVSTQAKRQPAIMFTAPVFDANHRLVAIFAGSLSLLKSNFIGNLAATRIGKQGYVYLYNRDRIIIIHPEQDRILQKDVPVGSNFLFDEAVHGFEGSGETVNSRGFATLSSFKQLRTKNWILAANHPLAEVYAPIAEVKTYFLLVSLVVLAAVLLGVRLSLKFLTDPLITFTSHVQNMSQKTGTERLSGIETNDEIGALSNAFNDMIQKLDQQKQALVHSEQRYRGIFESAHDAIFVETLDGQIIDANPAACHTMQYSREELMGMSVAQLLPPEVTVTPAERMKQVLAFHSSPFIAENLRKDGSRITFEITSRAFSTNSSTYVVIIARDITERMQLEAELRYLNQHDTLTGLFSRSFFEEESQRLCDKEFSPLGVVICDIDGLKLINDTLGHSAGDYLIRTAANLIRNCFRDTDIVARFGGDEVAILLPNCSKLVIQNACQRISDAIFKYNMTSRGLPLSISVGYAIGAENKNNTISDLFREADDNMYREKLKNSQSARQALFQSIMQNADEKDFRLGGHSDRIKILAEKLANSIGLPLARITALRRLAQYHAIGTVGIPEQILFKPGPLTHQERVKMQRHSDIGRRIAQSIPELSTIADLIWKHHEWWDGNGYPLGLEGDEIPIECRILAIVEAYDAMTHNRPYRTAMTVDKAKAELVRCAGSQFDPELTQRFLELLEEQLNTVGAAG